jgi:hypothetical protein
MQQTPSLPPNPLPAPADAVVGRQAVEIAQGAWLVH